MSRLDTPNGTPPNRPRVGVVVVDDGLYTHRWVSALFEASDFDVVCAACLSPFRAVGFNPGGAGGLWRVSRSRTRYYGPAATLRFAAKWAWGRASDLLFNLRLARRPHSVASAVRARGIDVFSPPRGNVNAPGFCKRLASYRPDLLVCAFSQPAGPVFLRTPRLGCLNVHFSLLPAHRGREPLFRAMLDGQGAGVSAHWMTPEIDAGAIVRQESFEITSCKTLHQAILRACDAAARVVPAAIGAAAQGEGNRSNTADLPDVRGWPSGEEVARFKKQGFRFV